MAKLVEAFDMMTAQENAFLGVLRNIVVRVPRAAAYCRPISLFLFQEIHDQATKDVAAEIEHMENKEEKQSEQKEPNDGSKTAEEDREEDGIISLLARARPFHI